MKKLILSLVLLSTCAWSANEVDELPQDELNKKLISTVKEFEIEGMLDQSAEFKECKDENKFTSSLTTAQKETNAEKAVECFKKKLASKKNPEDLGKLSDALGLQSYGLVNSKTSKDLTEYFGDRMYKALTGVDRKEKDAKKLMESMKFKNQKLVDQKVFFQLYRTQLMKNSLFEISRFCFENFRREMPNHEPGGKGFGEYWAPVLNTELDINQVTDTGSKGFGDLSDSSSKDAIYQNIFKSLDVNATDKFQVVQSFFNTCSTQILPLCKEFEKDPKNSKKGANACLAKAKIQKYRKAIADVKKVMEGMDKDMNGDGKGMKIADMPGFYDGTVDGENSIDNLTNYASSQFVEGGLTTDDKLKNKQDICSKTPENAECEDFIVIDDSRQKVEHNMDMDLRLKKEIEIARVKALKDADAKKLEEYLTENGYLDLLEKWKKDNNVDVEKEIGTIFEARRVAALAELKQKVGTRQMSEEEAKSGKTKEDNIKANVIASKEERARLAQVVLFNNIITGYISLTKKGESKPVGTNINVLKSETKGLETANVDSSLFENLKKSSDGESAVKGGLFEDAVILDNILGKPVEDPTAKNN